MQATKRKKNIVLNSSVEVQMQEGPIYYFLWFLTCGRA